MSVSRWLPVLVLFVLLALAFVGMYRGWKHDLPSLVEAPPVAKPSAPRLQAGARYFGTSVNGDALDRVVAGRLGARSSCRPTADGAPGTSGAAGRRGAG